jgi:cob(I)alamin adenosyltransferase
LAAASAALAAARAAARDAERVWQKRHLNKLMKQLFEGK